MTYLTKGEILFIHSAIIDETGGSHGLRDLHALASAEDLPKQQAYGKELYPTLFHKGAVYMRNIIGAHPFIDGNKRTAISAAGVFLELNAHALIAKDGDIERFALQVIREKFTIDTIASWLKRHSKRA